MSKILPIESIKVDPKRQRYSGRSEQDHQDLFVSISEGEAGLIHAPVLWKDGDDYWLVVGEGRLKVIREMNELGLPLRYEGEVIPEGHTPFTLVGELSPIGRYEAEYDENVRRTPLTVAEKASATAHLFELKKMKASAAGLPPPTIGDLAIELRGSSIGDYHTETRRELIVAQHLDDPDVRKATSVKDAFNVIKKKETQRKAAKLAAEIGPQVKAHQVELVHADAVDWLQKAPDGRFDIVLSDPPYGMGADGFGQYNQNDVHRYDDSHESWQQLMEAILPELARVTKEDAHLYLFCDFDRFHELKRMLEALAGVWTVHRTPLIWVNPTGFRTPWPDSGPQRKYECILYAKRGEKKTLKVFPDVLMYARDKESVHAAQKPIALLRDLLARSALPTDAVLDFCGGSGSTAIACYEAKLACVCIEKEAEAYGAAVKRLQDATKGN